MPLTHFELPRVHTTHIIALLTELHDMSATNQVTYTTTPDAGQTAREKALAAKIWTYKKVPENGSGILGV